MRETTWHEERASAIETLARRAFGQCPDPVHVRVPALPAAVTVAVRAAPRFAAPLRRLFAMADLQAPDFTLFFLGERARGDLRDRYGGDTPCIGLYDPDARMSLVSGIESFGLLKSVVIGLASLKALGVWRFPAHGCLIALGTHGILIVGGHGAGKTTCLLEIMRRTESADLASVLTDDWALFDFNGASLTGQPLESLISLDAAVGADFADWPRLHHLLAAGAQPDTRAVFLSPSELFPHLTPRANVRVERVIVLGRLAAAGWRRELSAEKCATLVVRAAYHMPDVAGVAEAEHHFWLQAVRDLDLHVVDTRCPDLPREELFNRLLAFLRA